MQTQIANLVSQLTGNATMFTAFDITMMLRRANPSTNVRHGEVRDAVHNLFIGGDMPSYHRTLQRMDNGQEAFVHHRYGDDPEDYDPHFFSTTTPQNLSVPNGLTTAQPIPAGGSQVTVQIPTPVSQTGNAAVSAPVGNSLAIKPKRARYAINAVPKDKFGRIRVPASVMRASGFKPKDTVRVVIDPNLIVVTPGNDVYGSTNGKKYVVDEYNNIRVHLRGKFQAPTFTMQPQGTRIYINPV